MNINLQTIETIENGAEEPFDFYLAVQTAINDGAAWSFQGSYGRMMMEALQDGRCLLGREPAADAYGNRIPSRFEVKAGTLGSFEYVVEQTGSEWASGMASVGTEG